MGGWGGISTGGWRRRCGRRGRVGRWSDDVSPFAREVRVQIGYGDDNEWINLVDDGDDAGLVSPVFEYCECGGRGIFRVDEVR